MVSWGHSGSQKDSSTFSCRSICPGILQPHLQLRSEEKHLLILSFIFQFVCLLYEQELRVSILHSYLCRLLLLHHPGILAMHHTWLLWLQRHNRHSPLKIYILEYHDNLNLRGRWIVGIWQILNTSHMLWCNQVWPDRSAFFGEVGSRYSCDVSEKLPIGDIVQLTTGATSSDEMWWAPFQTSSVGYVFYVSHAMTIHLCVCEFQVNKNTI